MKKYYKAFVIVLLVIAIILLIIVKVHQKRASATREANKKNPGISFVTKLPKLLDFGAEYCVPCKMMKPILGDLKENYRDQLEMYYVDLDVTPAIAGQYGINVIPTQIFFDANGIEKFRHEGFMDKDSILDKIKEIAGNRIVSAKN
jgi:thioredoxin 1